MSLSNALSDPQGGLIARHFPDAHDPQEFLSSPACEELNHLLLRTIKRKCVCPRAANGRKGKGGLLVEVKKIAYLLFSLSTWRYHSILGARSFNYNSSRPIDCRYFQVGS
jgi:hypothetical protein